MPPEQHLTIITCPNGRRTLGQIIINQNRGNLGYPNHDAEIFTPFPIHNGFNPRFDENQDIIVDIEVGTNLFAQGPNGEIHPIFVPTTAKLIDIKDQHLVIELPQYPKHRFWVANATEDTT